LLLTKRKYRLIVHERCDSFRFCVSELPPWPMLASSSKFHTSSTQMTSLATQKLNYLPLPRTVKLIFQVLITITVNHASTYQSPAFDATSSVGGFVVQSQSRRRKHLHIDRTQLSIIACVAVPVPWHRYSTHPTLYPSESSNTHQTKNIYNWMWDSVPKIKTLAIKAKNITYLSHPNTPCHVQFTTSWAMSYLPNHIR
jgi:hypothetical protein